MLRRYLAVALVLSQFSGTASAEPATGDISRQAESSQCEAEPGQIIGPLDAEAAAALNADVKPQGEFESTRQYNARLDAAGLVLPVTLFVTVPIDKKYITYDAETQKFSIDYPAIGNANLPWEALRKTSTIPWISPLPSANYIDIVVKWTETVTGSYKASNAYGVATTVRQKTRRTIGILERPAVGNEDLFFSDRPWSSQMQTVIAQIAVDPAKAPAWRSNLRAAVLIQPKPPFVINGTKNWGAPRIDKPEEVTERITAIVADIRCIVLTDEKNVVLASLPTR